MRLGLHKAVTRLLASMIVAASPLPALAESTSIQQLFAKADQLCLHRHQDPDSDAYKQCRAKQSIAIARLMQGMAMLPDQTAFGPLFQACLLKGPDMAAGFPDFDEGLNCVVAQVPTTRAIFFSDEQQ
ncbi:hypothetical protein X739_01365 [Mesorhizobium sp. LNHC220B00]|nr:hypothetical protein [Mesorhizobium sp. LNHC220B00]ESY89082.1 hypothetical protein X739_01365 [Mesorhizobium sp. LNHC220B00]